MTAHQWVADVEEELEFGVHPLADLADSAGESVVGLAGLVGVGVAVVVMGARAAAVGVAGRDDLGDEAAHLQALEGDEPVEVGEGDLAHEPVHGLGPLFGRGPLGVRPDAAEVLFQGGFQPEMVNGRLIVLLDVGQAVQGQPALAGETIPLELDGDVVLQFVSQGEDEGFDSGFGLAVHRFTVVTQSPLEWVPTPAGCGDHPPARFRFLPR